MSLVGGGEHLGFVDVINAKCFKNLRFDKVTDAGLRHNGNRHRSLDSLDHLGVTHAGDSAVNANICRNPLKRHDGTRTSILCNPSLLRIDYIHDDSTAEHLGESTLDELGAG